MLAETCMFSHKSYYDSRAMENWNYEPVQQGNHPFQYCNFKPQGIHILCAGMYLVL
jgi:hypothetical protein